MRARNFRVASADKGGVTLTVKATDGSIIVVKFGKALALMMGVDLRNQLYGKTAQDKPSDDAS